MTEQGYWRYLATKKNDRIHYKLKRTEPLQLIDMQKWMLWWSRRLPQRIASHLNSQFRYLQAVRVQHGASRRWRATVHAFPIAASISLEHCVNTKRYGRISCFCFFVGTVSGHVAVPSERVAFHTSMCRRLIISPPHLYGRPHNHSRVSRVDASPCDSGTPSRVPCSRCSLRHSKSLRVEHRSLTVAETNNTE